MIRFLSGLVLVAMMTTGAFAMADGGALEAETGRHLVLMQVGSFLQVI